jgi:hypothetical protein
MSGCDVRLMGRGRLCGAEPARAFTAYCGCGDKITGLICENCTLCRLPRCLLCWRGGAGHSCPVEFASAQCLCGCGQPVPIAKRNQSRDRIVRGRPLRYVAGHNIYLRARAEAS